MEHLDAYQSLSDKQKAKLHIEIVLLTFVKSLGASPQQIEDAEACLSRLGELHYTDGMEAVRQVMMLTALEKGDSCLVRLAWVKKTIGDLIALQEATDAQASPPLSS